MLDSHLEEPRVTRMCRPPPEKQYPRPPTKLIATRPSPPGPRAGAGISHARSNPRPRRRKPHQQQLPATSPPKHCQMRSPMPKKGNPKGMHEQNPATLFLPQKRTLAVLNSRSTRLAAVAAPAAIGVPSATARMKLRRAHIQSRQHGRDFLGLQITTSKSTTQIKKPKRLTRPVAGKQSKKKAACPAPPWPILSHKVCADRPLFPRSPRAVLNWRV